MLISDGISSSYDQVRVLSDISMNIKEGEVLGLLGRNGAGKSTPSGKAFISSINGRREFENGAVYP